MRSAPNLRTLKFKQPDPNTGIVYHRDIDGWYLIPVRGVTLKVIASNGEGRDHVSVSLPHRTPTHEELEAVRALFFRDDETIIQYSVPREDHINFHKYCLHLWRPQNVDVPRPPAILVGPVPA